MSEPGGPEAAPTDPQADPVTEASAPTGDSPAELERRAFVKQMATDTVSMAGRIAGFSRIITRSATAAGQAMITELGAMQAEAAEPVAETGAPVGEGVPQAPDVAVATVATADPPAPDPAPPPVAAARPEPPAPVRPKLTVDAEQLRGACGRDAGDRGGELRGVRATDDGSHDSLGRRGHPVRDTRLVPPHHASCGRTRRSGS